MRATVEVDGRPYEVVVDRKAGTVTVDGHAFPVRLERNAAGLLVRAGDRAFHVRPGDHTAVIEGRSVAWRVLDLAAGDGPAGSAGQGTARVKPPMNGKIEKVLVSPGQAVQKGDVLFVLEAMKMHNEVRSPIAGQVVAVHGQVGATVEPSAVVVEIGPA